MENSAINTNQKMHETTSEYAITDYEELNDLELENVAGGFLSFLIPGYPVYLAYRYLFPLVEELEEDSVGIIEEADWWELAGEGIEGAQEAAAILEGLGEAGLIIAL
ncbi:MULTISPECIES: hypothetical protein [Okeania]|uniref:Uncharacterized protein n=1 Tax=Okeania hirsuta TaxID=1458930 RepID=A0A3N6PLE5_9CYAN|nr:MULTISPECIES: hypothetical protein [Okeania]NES92377.1 hypothetical protein [Okeania sp. SIO2B9]RQH56552.1 hypothetical protein D5R40_01545 [Okeania hirsuta]